MPFVSSHSRLPDRERSEQIVSSSTNRGLCSRIKLHRTVCVSHARQDKASCCRLRIEPFFGVHSHMSAQQLCLAGSTLSLPAERRDGDAMFLGCRQQCLAT